MNIEIKKIIFIIFLIASIIGGLTSCGTRKVTLQKEKEVVKTETEIAVVDNTKTETKVENNVKVETKVETNIETGEVTKTTTLEPIDNTKPASVINDDGTKTELFNSKKTTTETTSNSKKNKKEEQFVDTSNKVEQNQQNNIKTAAKSKSETKSKSLNKDIVSEKGNFWNWIILIVALILIIWFVLWSRKFVKEKENMNL